MQTRSQTLLNATQQSKVKSPKVSSPQVAAAISQRPVRSTRKFINYAELADETEDTFFEPKPKTFKSEPAPRYEVEIDFDEASRAWRANKRLVGQCHFAYRTQEKDNIRKEVIEHVERRSARLAKKSAESYA